MVKISNSRKILPNLGLTYDDVLIVPGYSEVMPNEVDLKTKLTRNISLNIPLVSAAMDTVTESKAAIAIARQGGIGIIHRNLTIERQAEEVQKVKRAEFWIITDPVTIKPNDTLATLFAMQKQTGLNSFPVVQDGNKLVGIVTPRDLLFEDDPSKKIKEIMTTNLVTVDRAIDIDAAKKILHKNKIEKLPIMDSKGNLKGLITVKDVESRARHPNASKDGKGRLIVGAAVGPFDLKRVQKLVEAECDVIAIDTSHGHAKAVLDATRQYKKEFKNVPIIAGNAATAEATEDLISRGADAVKVGVGPGAICTTRVVTGSGMPQLTAVLDSAEVAEKHKIPIIADGGIKFSGDITKAIAAGAHSVMIGSLFAGCEETPGKTVYLFNRKFKQYRGMGSVSAMAEGGKERYFQGEITDSKKLVPQGIEGVVPFKGPIEELVYQLLGGLRAGMGLAGCKTIEELRKKAKFLQITEASLRESHPHDVKITEEAPNYSLGQ